MPTVIKCSNKNKKPKPFATHKGLQIGIQKNGTLRRYEKQQLHCCFFKNHLVSN